MSLWLHNISEISYNIFQVEFQVERKKSLPRFRAQMRATFALFSPKLKAPPKKLLPSIAEKKPTETSSKKSNKAKSKDDLLIPLDLNTSDNISAGSKSKSKGKKSEPIEKESKSSPKKEVSKSQSTKKKVEDIEPISKKESKSAKKKAEEIEMEPKTLESKLAEKKETKAEEIESKSILKENKEKSKSLESTSNETEDKSKLLESITEQMKEKNKVLEALKEEIKRLEELKSRTIASMKKTQETTKVSSEVKSKTSQKIIISTPKVEKNPEKRVEKIEVTKHTETNTTTIEKKELEDLKTKATYQIFTDGACIPNPGPGGWASIMLSTIGAKRTILQGMELRTTSNRMVTRYFKISGDF
jgi:myosin heavy subunit